MRRAAPKTVIDHVAPPAPRDAAVAGAPARSSIDRLFSATYEELRRLAACVRRGDPCATLTPTALVNEAWLKLARSPSWGATSELHFKRIAARAMRQLLIEAARRRMADKRGAGAAPVSMGVALDLAAAPLGEQTLLRLDAALETLAGIAPRQAALVESRFFGGFDVPTTAAMLQVSEATVLRDWRAARAFLAAELRAD